MNKINFIFVQAFSDSCLVICKVEKFTAHAKVDITPKIELIGEIT